MHHLDKRRESIKNSETNIKLTDHASDANLEFRLAKEFRSFCELEKLRRRKRLGLSRGERERLESLIEREWSKGRPGDSNHLSRMCAIKSPSNRTEHSGDLENLRNEKMNEVKRQEIEKIMKERLLFV